MMRKQTLAAVRAIAVLAAALAVAPPAIYAQSLPDRVEPPAPAPGEQAPPAGEDAPLPSRRPTEGRIIPPDEMPPAKAPALPEPRPEPPAAGDTDTELKEPPPPPASARPPSRGSLVPPEEMACRTRLAGMGVRFEVRPAEGDGADCAMPFPLSVETLSKTIAIEPPALINCATAEATARFVQTHVAPLARKLLDGELAAVRQVSGYVCRTRNGTRTISEHATGNAIDLGGFVLEDGREIAVEKSSGTATGRFLAKLRHAACGPFKTVLGPGSDADHADHFHFDLAERRGGSAYCR